MRYQQRINAFLTFSANESEQFFVSPLSGPVEFQHEVEPFRHYPCFISVLCSIPACIPCQTIPSRAISRVIPSDSDDDKNSYIIKDDQRLHKRFAVQVEFKETLLKLLVWAERGPRSRYMQDGVINNISFFLWVRRVLVVLSLIVAAVMVSNERNYFQLPCISI